jgi:predicted aminopeptidase
MKRILKILSIVLLVLIAWNYEMVIYGAKQGIGQVEILSNAVPVEEALQGDEYTEEQKAKMRWIQVVRQFAVDSLGLVESENYTTIYNQGDKPILWVVEACPEFSLEPYKWDYPFLGSLGYKGFFEYSLAEEEANRLRKEGFETEIRTVSGWSTLGWFKDPILSNMLKRSDARLADLIIHELTHATMYVKGDDKLNENIATLIGRRGAMEMLHSVPGKEPELKAYQGRLSDFAIYAAHLNRGYQRLDSLYAQMDGLSLDEKRVRKIEMIRTIFEDADTLIFSDSSRFQFLARTDTIPGNTYFTGYSQYNALQDSLAAVLDADYNGSIKSFITDMKARYGSVSK